ncbi:unnamed protein product [Penicillium salamii]|uniref:Uncharacterized protein n=1 Tax=Penicillium salamii TaxID=1612424 RepID=A0A9W4JM47_9EURO|nr:unnamed protein product [Penicillium salamii]CAG8110191.1 unnamed protein product [Penicillium salamii]CAG8121706.1 unnamed protein product [Penicillium salamii]CAG8133405.1 unnamed protein product [Penicillium salamii]CAG8156696.1 unnamed protein product [Penicillium salamii]
MEYLTDLEGTQVTFDAVADPPFNFPAQKWIILEKLGEDSNRLTKEDIAAELGPSDTAGKFLCRPAGEVDDNRRAFLRIYQQLPIAGTETKKAAVRASQAVNSPPDYPELIAFRTFMKLGCDVVPRLLGYQERQQDHDEGVPGGYITYILWEKSRWRAIRDQFRQVYTKFLLCGFIPCMAGPSKIIHDKSSGQMHICGFKRAARFDEPRQWSDINYFLYGLIHPSGKRIYWEGTPPETADWIEDVNGWTW